MKKKYSRSERVQSQLLKSAKEIDQTLLTSFFDYTLIRKIEVIIEENESGFEKSLPDKTVVSKKLIDKSIVAKEVSPLLKAFLSAAQDNESKRSNGRRYDDSLKKFSCILYLLSGRMTYEILYANLQRSLPSISTIKTLLDKETKDFKMGVIRVSKLKNWLLERKYPLRVCIAEDQTKVVESVQYNSKANCLDGLSPPLGSNGFPIENPYTAKDALDIISSINKGTLAAYVNVFVVQPQVFQKSPGFCLCVYPTDNRFNYHHCLQRWKFLENLLKYEGGIVQQ